ncbi:MAG: hypothetical protein K2Z81_20220, partial [Cyanobacteria bacterium]|nr:hypothetical protein [Cyanobacteriota bacterium]
ERILEARSRLLLPQRGSTNKQQQLPDDFADLAEQFNQSAHFSCSLLFSGSKKSWIARVQAAFHANGISFDQTRMLHPHYQHLVEAADGYVNLWTSRQLALMKTEEKREIYICVKEEDLMSGLLDKCLPVIM